jgi:hypothetical protein
MFPGLTTKLSESILPAATTIYPKTDYVRVEDTTSTTVIATISAPYTGFSGVLFVHNSSGASMTTVTTGNILTAVTIGSNALVVFVYSMTLNKFVVGALA